MLDKANADTIFQVAAAIGWLALLYTTIRTAIRYMVGKHDGETDLATALNRDLLKVLAEQYKEMTEVARRLEVKQARMEAQLLGLEARIKEKR